MKTEKLFHELLGLGMHWEVQAACRQRFPEAPAIPAKRQECSCTNALCFQEPDQVSHALHLTQFLGGKADSKFTFKRKNKINVQMSPNPKWLKI
jgi:hypothetical protein